MTPFDNEAVGIDTSGALFKQQFNHWQLGVFGDYKFEASQLQMHLFMITLFVAVVAPFGAIFFTALKHALKAEQLGKILSNSGVIDRVDCLIITGLFMFIYIQLIVYKQTDAVKVMQDMILKLSPEN